VDDFKRHNVDLATATEYNAKKYVKLKNRGRVGKRIRKLARSRLKANLRRVTDEQI